MTLVHVYYLSSKLTEEVTFKGKISTFLKGRLGLVGQSKADETFFGGKIFARVLKPIHHILKLPDSYSNVLAISQTSTNQDSFFFGWPT